MSSCQEEGIRDRNRAGIEAVDPARSAGSTASNPARFRSRRPSSCMRNWTLLWWN
eukprot:gene20459-biopygen6739